LILLHLQHLLSAATPRPGQRHPAAPLLEDLPNPRTKLGSMVTRIPQKGQSMGAITLSALIAHRMPGCDWRPLSNEVNAVQGGL